MTLSPFRGRCHTCGHDHDAEDGDRILLRELFAVCEDDEDKYCRDSCSDFERGRAFEAKYIRRGIGQWYQDTFCGRTHMGEPVVDKPKSTTAELPPVWGVGRCPGEPNDITVTFRREPTDDELRALHDLVRAHGETAR